MGAGSSNTSSEQIDTKLIDKIASEYILSMNFQDMKKMNTEAGCSKMVLIVENILKQHTTEVPLSSLQTASRGLFNLAAPPSGEESIFVFPEGNEEEKKILDVSDAKKKQLICRNIAKFYVQVAHLFSAIIMTINPKYQYSEGDETKTVSIMNKKDIPEESLAGANIILEKNYCSERESLLSSKSKLEDDNDISISIPYCKLNEEIIPIGESKGIKELEELFKDDYDPTTGIFTMSKESEKQYKKMVSDFYKLMNDSGTSPDSFADFKLPKYNEERGCSDTALQKFIIINDNESNPDTSEVDTNEGDTNEGDTNEADTSKADTSGADTIEIDTTIKEENKQPPFKETYKGTYSGLFKEFKNNINSMKQTTAKNTNAVFENLGLLFNLKSDPITLNPNINPKTIGPLIVDTREKIERLYLDCESFFQKGLDIFRNIVYQTLSQQVKEEIMSLEDLGEKTLSS